LTVLVARRMYAFHASDPDSRPPPVSFSPPNAPPISAPDVPMFTLTMPQSEPSAEVKISASAWSVVNTDDESPCPTLLFSAIASAKDSYGMTYSTGANVSSRTIGVCPGIRTSAGSA
jgi:hypothetical protein